MTDKQARWQHATVQHVDAIADGITRIVLSPEMPTPARPGEHVDVLVTLPDGRTDERSYSIVGAAQDGSYLAISVAQPAFSRGGSDYMRSLRPSSTLRVTQPLQDFPLRVGAPSYVLVAGGVGITAIRGMASALRRLGADYVLHYVGNSRERMAYLPQLEERHGDRLITHVTTEHGRMSVQALVDAVPPNAELYMCGPIRLMEEIRRTWERDGRDMTALRYETFGNSGWFEPTPFEVTVPRLGVTVTVGQGESMLEALERAGVDMMYDCRRGECGLCEVEILDLSGKVDHRDVFYSERQKAPNKKMCCCVSRVTSADTSTTGRVHIEVT